MVFYYSSSILQDQFFKSCDFLFEERIFPRQIGRREESRPAEPAPGQGLVCAGRTRRPLQRVQVQGL